MFNKKNLKFIIAFLAFCLFSVFLWHCKKDNGPTAPSDAPDLVISVSPSNASVAPSNSITFIGYGHAIPEKLPPPLPCVGISLPIIP